MVGFAIAYLLLLFAVTGDRGMSHFHDRITISAWFWDVLRFLTIHILFLDYRAIYTTGTTRADPASSGLAQAGYESLWSSSRSRSDWNRMNSMSWFQMRHISAILPDNEVQSNVSCARALIPSVSRAEHPRMSWCKRNKQHLAPAIAQLWKFC